MAHRCVPAPFLTKTYQLVEDSNTDDVVSWNETGTTFVVWKPADFARDLLPNYFKHNNFSSFVRQLNTYAFRKIVPDRWEFANDYFKRGEKELLSEIHRRKVVHLPPTKTPQTVLPDGKSNGSSSLSAPSNPSEDQTSSATSNHGSKSTHPLEETTNTNQLCDLSNENEKLKKHNEILSSELAQTKKQCGELINVLSKYFNVASGEIDRIMLEGSTSGSRSSHGQTVDIYEKEVVDDDENGRNEEEGMKLFGVWLKGSNRKRVRDEVDSNVRGSSALKEMKTMDYRGAPWMQITSSPGESSKVCN